MQVEHKLLKSKKKIVTAQNILNIQIYRFYWWFIENGIHDFLLNHSAICMCNKLKLCATYLTQKKRRFYDTLTLDGNNTCIHLFFYNKHWYIPLLTMTPNKLWHNTKFHVNGWIWFHILFFILIYRLTLARRYNVITGFNTIGWIHPTRTSSYTGGFWGKNMKHFVDIH